MNKRYGRIRPVKLLKHFVFFIVIPDDQLVLDETPSSSSSITSKSLSSAQEVENEAGDEKMEPVQTDCVMEFKGVDEYD